MSDTRYNIVFKGEIIDGCDLSQVKTDLAHLFKKEIAQVEKLFTGRSVILKKNVDLLTAQKYQRELQMIGARCHLERLQEEPPNPVTPPDQHEEKSTLLICPKCRYPLKPDEPCPQCILAASRESLPQSGLKTQWNRILKGQTRGWYLYFVIGLTVVIMAIQLFAPRGTVSSDLLINRKFEFQSVERPENPVRIAWDFSKNSITTYKLEYYLENIDLPQTEESENDFTKTLHISGEMRIEGQADRTAHVIQDESTVYGFIDLIVDGYRVPNTMGNTIPRRLYAGLRENGQISVPESSVFPFFSILFQLPDKVLTEGMTVERFLRYRYIHQYYDRWLAGNVRLTLNSFVKIDGRICARILMTTLFEDDPHIPFADEYTTAHCALNLFWDIETRSVLCGRLIISGDTRYSDVGYGGDYYSGHKTREIITFIQKDYLKACK
ncbi:hypothetical protein HQ585_18520 [candidate division KSB1 bacterium]|nr:hypothetical protein [candidate division KSB1 bacterium]